MSITASAPGKLLLLGDHAVVYKYPCLVTAMDLRIQVTVEKIHSNQVVIETPTLRKLNQKNTLPLEKLLALQTYDPQIAFVLASTREVFSKFGINQGVEIQTYGPQNSYGLGSSSATTVATVYALVHLFELKISKREVFELAYSAVLNVQKMGSGFDVAAAVYGGTLYYASSEKIETLSVAAWPVIVGYSGQKGSTTQLVQHVKQLRERNNKVIDSMFRTIGNIVELAKSLPDQEKWEAFGELVNINHGLLSSLGVSTLDLERLIYTARSMGAYGAKLSGAGGGDCMFAVVDERSREKVEKALQTAGAVIVPIQPNAQGVRLE